MSRFISYLQSKLPGISDTTCKILQSGFVAHQKQKGDLLLRQGDVCRHLYFLSEGLTRSYSIKDGKDITTWFSFQYDFITSFTSFFPQRASYESIEMLSDGELYGISYYDLIQMREKSLDVERAINHFSQLYTIELEQRLFMIQTHTALEHYQYIMEREPHLIQQVPNKHLASYLGVTRETLSRIRASIN